MRISRKPAMAAALVCCGALVLSGCGSSGSSGEAASSAPVAEETAPAVESAAPSTPAESEAPPEATPEGTTDETTEGLEALGDVEVDQGLLAVTVTLPADFSQDVTQADIDKAIADGEIQAGQINDDGTVTYELSKSQHDAILDELRASVDEIVAGENETNPGLYEEVTYNDEMTEFTVVVSDRKKYEQSMSMLALGLVFGAGFYQVFYGVPEEDRNVVIEYVDGKTGDVFDTFDAREEMS